MNCPNCEHENVTTVGYCKVCGAPLTRRLVIMRDGGHIMSGVWVYSEREAQDIAREGWGKPATSVREVGYEQ